MGINDIIIPNAQFSLHQDNHQNLLKSVEIGNTPQYLYKYLSIDRFMQFLSNGKLLFSRYDMLNDPFECTANVRIQYSYEEWLDFLLGADTDLTLAQSEAKKLSADIEYARFVTGHALTTSLNKDGFLCLTKKFDNLLMWAHYTDSHKGVCLEFDITKDLDTFYIPFAVEYTNEYPCYDYIYDNGGAIRSILHKSPDWAYEEEYRIVKPGGYGLCKVRPESLTSVIFGCQFDKTLFPQIRQSVQDAGFHPQYKMMQRSNKEYKLHVQEYRF